MAFVSVVLYFYWCWFHWVLVVAFYVVFCEGRFLFFFFFFFFGGGGGGGRGSGSLLNMIGKKRNLIRTGGFQLSFFSRLII